MWLKERCLSVCIIVWRDDDIKKLLLFLRKAGMWPLISIKEAVNDKEIGLCEDSIATNLNGEVHWAFT